MGASKSRAQQIRYSRDPFLNAKVLDGLLTFIAVLERQLTALLRLDHADGNFLQMRFRALIIAQRKLYEFIGRKTSTKIFAELFWRIRHELKGSTNEKR